MAFLKSHQFIILIVGIFFSSCSDEPKNDKWLIQDIDLALKGLVDSTVANDYLVFFHQNEYKYSKNSYYQYYKVFDEFYIGFFPLLYWEEILYSGKRKLIFSIRNNESSEFLVSSITRNIYKPPLNKNFLTEFYKIESFCEKNLNRTIKDDSIFERKISPEFIRLGFYMDDSLNPISNEIYYDLSRFILDLNTSKIFNALNINKKRRLIKNILIVLFRINTKSSDFKLHESIELENKSNCINLLQMLRHKKDSIIETCYWKKIGFDENIDYLTEYFSTNHKKNNNLVTYLFNKESLQFFEISIRDSSFSVKYINYKNFAAEKFCTYP